MESNYEDNFYPVSTCIRSAHTEILKKPNRTEVSDRTIEKCQKSNKIALYSKPKRNQNKMHDPKYREYVKRGEFNPFIHNAWLLMGKAHL